MVYECTGDQQAIGYIHPSLGKGRIHGVRKEAEMMCSCFSPISSPAVSPTLGLLF